MPGTIANCFISKLPIAMRELLLSHLEPVPLKLGEVLYEPERTPRYGHFVTSGLASIVMEMADGTGSEVMTIGDEGLVQTVHLLGSGIVNTRSMMQIGGTGLRMPFPKLQMLVNENVELLRALLRLMQYQTGVVSQVAACNRLHPVEQRLARWLLMVQERIGSDQLNLTQQFLAEMIGARRTTVTEVAGVLQRAGLIEYSRGRVRILNRAGLEAAACECSRAISRLYRNL